MCSLKVAPLGCRAGPGAGWVGQPQTPRGQQRGSGTFPTAKYAPARLFLPFYVSMFTKESYPVSLSSSLGKKKLKIPTKTLNNRPPKPSRDSEGVIPCVWKLKGSNLLRDHVETLFASTLKRQSQLVWRPELLFFSRSSVVQEANSVPGGCAGSLAAV